MTDFPRLIEHAFPLKQTSLDSVHEKNVRHGHISTLHIWPARRPLAACRAALIATLLPDPSAEPKPAGMSDEQWQSEIARRRQELCEKIAGKVVKRIERKTMPNGQKVERIKEETEGGILHWGRETENAETLEWFRQEIRKAYGGRAPKVLDPFAGGGAIPLEAMRLGCEATAVDINPVAWFILKCTLEYPQKLAGQKRPLPDFILKNAAFMREFFKAQGMGKTEIESAVAMLGHAAEPGLFGVTEAPTKGKGRRKRSNPTSMSRDELIQADLAWHVRAWGQWVLDRARRELAQYYPTYADFEPIKKDQIAYEPQPMRLVPLKEDGTPDIDSLNAEFTDEYLEDKRNPRWVAKPTVAYLWARTVKCKNCRAIVPLLKTRWLCKKPNKRVLLTMEPNTNRTGVVFGVETNVPAKGGNAAQKREHDKRLGAGTMSRAGAQCPCCGAINTMEDLRLEGKAGRLGNIMTAEVVDGPNGKEYRLPTVHERAVGDFSEAQVNAAFQTIPYGPPDEPTPTGGGTGAGRAFSVQGYGLMKWRDLFTARQFSALGTFARSTRAAREEMAAMQYSDSWVQGVGVFLACLLDKLPGYNSTGCVWHISGEKAGNTFMRFALQITWDFMELPLSNDVGGAYAAHLDWVGRAATHLLNGIARAATPAICNHSATETVGEYDAIVTDPPYYDAIPYSDLMDFFYIWLRRSLFGVAPSFDIAFAQPLSPKWDHEKNDGELIDDSSRHGLDAELSKRIYEDGMARVFAGCCKALKPEGRIVIVFANKQPDAWETLVAAIIRAGFVVDGSWPIQTEMTTRMRAKTSAALASSVWLVGKKRPTIAQAGWDNKVLEEMRKNITLKLREFWDAGIRGPDFVWAATGPALEAYSKHPVVRKANEPGNLTVTEFLTHVRRMVVDYIVGQVLTGEQGADMAAADRLDEVTAYYLLHRHDFGMDDAPVGACILYATACGLSDSDLERTWDVIARTGGANDLTGEDAGATMDAGAAGDDEDAADGDAEAAEESTGGSKVKLKMWSQRRGRSMGYEAPEGKAVPLIDRIHRVMHLWKDGDVQKVDEYLDEHALRRHELFRRVVQSLIELSPPGNGERSLLESISNHIGMKGAVRDRGPAFVTADGDWTKKE